MEVARPPATGPKSISNKFRKDISLAICWIVFLFAAQAAYAQRVNSGGGNYTDSLGNLWAADNSFSGGGTLVIPESDVRGKNLLFVIPDEALNFTQQSLIPAIQEIEESEGVQVAVQAVKGLRGQP